MSQITKTASGYGDNNIDMIIRLERDQDVPNIIRQIQNAGVIVNQAHVGSRTVGGSGPRELLDSLAKIDGVKLCREEVSMSLPPFKEGVPQ